MPETLHLSDGTNIAVFRDEDVLGAIRSRLGDALAGWLLRRLNQCTEVCNALEKARKELEIVGCHLKKPRIDRAKTTRALIRALETLDSEID